MCPCGGDPCGGEHRLGGDPCGWGICRLMDVYVHDLSCFFHACLAFLHVGNKEGAPPQYEGTKHQKEAARQNTQKRTHTHRGRERHRGRGRRQGKNTCTEREGSRGGNGGTARTTRTSTEKGQCTSRDRFEVPNEYTDPKKQSKWGKMNSVTRLTLMQRHKEVCREGLTRAHAQPRG